MKTTYEVKLNEMSKEYTSMADTMRAYDWMEADQKELLVQRLMHVYKDKQNILADQIKLSKSPAIRKLADAQKTYFETLAELMKYEILKDLHCSETNADEDEREANALFAEYAIDFAEQSFRYAAIAVLNDEKLSR